MQSVGDILKNKPFTKLLNESTKPDFKKVSKLPFLKQPLLILNLILQDKFLTKRQIRIINFIERFSFGCKKATALLKLTDFYKISFYSSDITKELNKLVDKKYIGWDREKEEMWIHRRLLSESLAQDESYASEILRRNLVNHYQKKKCITSNNKQLATDTKAEASPYRYRKINIDNSNRYQNGIVDNNKREVQT